MPLHHGVGTADGGAAAAAGAGAAAAGAAGEGSGPEAGAGAGAASAAAAALTPEEVDRQAVRRVMMAGTDWAVGTARYCFPPHSITYNLNQGGFNMRLITWRATSISVWPY